MNDSCNRTDKIIAIGASTGGTEAICRGAAEWVLGLDHIGRKTRELVQ